MKDLRVVLRRKSLMVLHNSRMDCLHVLKKSGNFVTNSLYTNDFKPMSNQPRLTKTEINELRPIVITKLEESGILSA